MSNEEIKEFEKIVVKFSSVLRDAYMEIEDLKYKLEIISDLIEIDTEKDLQCYVETVGQEEVYSDPLLYKVRSIVLQNIIAWDRSRYELYYQGLFKKNVDKCISNARIITKKVIDKNYPDAWVAIGEEELPVEMKRDKFNEKALRQLQRYMKVYQTNRGIAVAPKLSVSLPDNIIFVPFDKFVEKQ